MFSEPLDRFRNVTFLAVSLPYTFLKEDSLSVAFFWAEFHFFATNFIEYLKLVLLNGFFFLFSLSSFLFDWPTEFLYRVREHDRLGVPAVRRERIARSR